MADNKILVNTKLGKIYGSQKTTEYDSTVYYSFRGIPYAEPPVEEFRFRNPRPKKPWTGIYDATQERDDCIQFSFILTSFIGSEDCLYLNVNVPEIPSEIKKAKSVMVMIHAGAFSWGSGSVHQQGNPDYVMHQDIIYITLNYRLHALGFLNLNMRDCPGNVGLKDIVLALKWIKENIQYFGGDPENVTLIGSSTGSLAIHCLMLSDTAKGLYHKVIMMGMYVYHPFLIFEENTVDLAYKFGKILGFEGGSKNSLLKFLKEASATDLVVATKVLFDEIKPVYKRVNPSSPFFPSIEYFEKGAFWSKSPVNMIDSINPVPVIFGVCEEESAFLYADDLKLHEPQHFSTVYRQQRWNWLYSLDDQQMEIIKRMVENRYITPTSDEEERIRQVIYAQSDLICLEFYDKVAEVIHRISPQTPIYIYKFQFVGELNGISNIIQKASGFRPRGSLHADDLYYWMCMPPCTKQKHPMVEFITRVFSNFAKFGNPTDPELNIEWQPSTKEQPCYLRINEESTLVQGYLNNDGLAFWRQIKNKFCASKNNFKSL